MTMVRRGHPRWQQIQVVHPTNPYVGLQKTGATARLGYLEIDTDSLRLYYEGITRLAIDASGNVTILSLAGTGSRTVVADANGVLSAP